MSSPEFNHFIATRFNVKIREFGTATKNGEQILSPEWLEHRFHLFENFCFPSVKNQSEMNFTWLVFFDTETPPLYKAKIEGFQKELPNFHPIYIDDHNVFFEVLRKTILNDNAADKKYVITSRLDNDDSIHKDYVKNIQATFNHQLFCLVDFTDGYNLSIENNIKLGKIRMPFNPFVSLIETLKTEPNSPATVFSVKHSDWHQAGDILSIAGKRVWIQIIHEKNKINSYQGNVLADYSKLHEDFGVSTNVLAGFLPVSKIKLMLQNIVVVPFVVLFQKLGAIKVYVRNKFL